SKTKFLQSLATEQPNASSQAFDTKSALEIATIINREDAKVAAAVGKCLPQIAQAIDAIADALGHGGRLIYIGAGTSGRIAAVEYASQRRAKTIGVSCISDSPLSRAADIAIAAEVGPEVISGSTRMKAGTAQKMILNMLTTGAMTRLGYVYGNLMVNVSPKNEKLVERAITILSKAADADRERARDALSKSGRSVPLALIMLKTGASLDVAKRLLRASRSHVRRAIESSGSAKPSGTR